MNKSEIDQKILDRIEQLADKYDAMGQDLASYLDGLLHADYLKYWDYINLDSLLGLQQPKTGFPDEMIFIIYHQITELYFKLIRWEMKQVHEGEHPNVKEFTLRLNRINNYLEHLCHSFVIMTEGMEKEQFLQFRMSLLPSSGFQSGQYRMIEIGATDMINLVGIEHRDDFDDYSSLDQLYDCIYWKTGATELKSGKKTLTLEHFEEKYSKEFLHLAEDTKTTNFYQLYLKHYKTLEGAEEVAKQLRRLDLLANVDWPLAHFKTAVRYLQRDPEDIAATGGTNWQKYLPPRFQKVIFFPELWSEEEKLEWGKHWVLKQLSGN
ncbi:tryptophan 2,3-dioxygenase family protein [Roseivirga pacifica]|uniref:tryptophan 2,3-dioxygenase family protein n=1 Tax=Roseivirga pacifica TaxID=1267423 RepID=UPI002094F48F|nr:tryptophan 2,3-dioxygenase family protein [Roseivirga pacifica]MCO6357308.1 tryptophan 2,3-dioxygenase [Roseivirga pacifica]MCO6367978.1 tryptophan 2,3-dioxygenase [Roseivirga pacifica]MCO6369540.1 tryptophan 2,3-dioxygenase [Roseivirga pacifica]MCO6373394.1 tryptophan 2,3-dioxygenase [Roseivirga pacifica]MCO6377349.1 tryptophan 2,3-dioxygenase [Roseivirga pacifica]